MSGNLEKRGEQCYRLRIARVDPVSKKRIVFRETLHCSLKEAQKVLRERLSEIERTGTVVKTPIVSLADYLERWLTNEAAITCKASTLQMNREYLALYVVGRDSKSSKAPLPQNRRLGKILLSQATPARLQDHFAWLHQERGLSALTVRRVATVISAALSSAVRQGLLPENPCARVALPRVPKKKPRRTLLPEEAQRFVIALREDRLGLIFEVILVAGLRPGEATGLLWPAVDFVNGLIRIETSLTRLKKGLWELTDPKTDTGVRAIPLPPHLMGRLREHKVKQELEKHAMGAAWVGTEPLVFCTTRGTPLNLRNLKHRHFRPILEKAGLEPLDFKGFYMLRHSAATLLLVKNAHPKVVSERLGHSTTRVTLDTYSHVIEGMQRGATDALDSIIYGAPAEENIGHALGTEANSQDQNRAKGTSRAKRPKPDKT